MSDGSFSGPASGPGKFTSRHLTVVGLGLIGGSMARALRGWAETITGVDMDAHTRDYALSEGIVDYATDDLREGVAEADSVVLATPVRTIMTLVQKRIGAYLRSNTLLIDVGSTKQDICMAMGGLPIGIQAIGGHPMAGKENSGVDASDAALFHGRPFVLCPTRRTTPATRVRALSLAEAVGAVPIEMEAHRHDHLVATISHLPYLLSAALVSTVAQQGKSDEAAWRLAAGGFRDMSRLAGSDISMMTDIFSTNTQAVATLLAHFRVQLAILETLLISRDEAGLAEWLTQARDARNHWAQDYGAGGNTGGKK
ncbi:MAG: prephenate dehydrogenase/arogenate dehydrogenase family protein [Burkholderiales bacterium]|nr:prephenate dehydrogenase/arogenate dehydrogenase family protein [Anaerolineae bacterium]